MGHPFIVFGRSLTESRRVKLYRALTFGITFIVYTSYHLNQKPISVVKAQLQSNGSESGWVPFNHKNGKVLLAILDYGYLFAYAIGLFVSGFIAERVDLRYFLTVGMMLRGVCTATFGFGYYLNIHIFGFYLANMIITGLFQSTGWPAVVTCFSNWFGKGKRGFIMGIWSAHTSVGNILGGAIAGLYVQQNWGLSFIVPGAIICICSIIVFIFLVPNPSDIGCHGPYEDTFIDLNDVQQSTSLLSSESSILIHTEEQSISILSALKIPGVVEFSFSLFFIKFVSFTFLFWLPNYIKQTSSYSDEVSANLSTAFDFGGILGSIAGGLISDMIKSRSIVCAAMSIIAIPLIYIFQLFESKSFLLWISLSFSTGIFVQGPYNIITTVVAADLGTHPSLRGQTKALSTVTAIIDGIGSIGAAVGPLLTGFISNWRHVFFMLIGSNILSVLLISRCVFTDVKNLCCGRGEIPESNHECDLHGYK